MATGEKRCERLFATFRRTLRPLMLPKTQSLRQRASFVVECQKRVVIEEFHSPTKIEIHDGPPIWSSSQQSWATDTITMQRRRDDDSLVGFWVRSRSAERPRNGFWGSEQKGLQLDFGGDFGRSTLVEKASEIILVGAK
ncbi:hypothetical protein Adt_21266 [Abeliophyllum distichum]|uniref:Uncharacterized protein n=1 Tax=Abeliophyllum distichum TaxID=126358 RepID=A0ABD1SYV3_9LAMI